MVIVALRRVTQKNGAGQGRKIMTVSGTICMIVITLHFLLRFEEAIP